MISYGAGGRHSTKLIYVYPFRAVWVVQINLGAPIFCADIGLQRRDR
jgi:hypothetical protein